MSEVLLGFSAAPVPETARHREWTAADDDDTESHATTFRRGGVGNIPRIRYFRPVVDARDERRRFPGSDRALFAPGDLLAHQRDQLATVFDGVIVRVVAADEDGRDAELDVVEDRRRHRLRRANQRGRVARRSGGRRQRGRERPIVPLAPVGRREQPLRPLVLRRSAAQRPGGRAARGLRRQDDVERAMGPLPGLLLGASEDRPEGRR